MFDRRLRRFPDESLRLFRHQTHLAFRGTLQAMVYRTLAAQPVVFQLVGPAHTGFAISLRDFEYVNGALAQVEQGLHAPRICAVVDHVSPSFCAAQPGPWPLLTNVTLKCHLQTTSPANLPATLPGIHRRLGVTLLIRLCRLN